MCVCVCAPVAGREHRVRRENVKNEGERKTVASSALSHSRDEQCLLGQAKVVNVDKGARAGAGNGHFQGIALVLLATAGGKGDSKVAPLALRQAISSRDGAGSQDLLGRRHAQDDAKGAEITPGAQRPARIGGVDVRKGERCWLATSLK